MIRKAEIEDIEELSILRVEHQKAEAKENNIIATCAVQIIEYLPLCTNLSGKIGYISNVYTKEKYRKQGIQKELMNICLEFTKKHDITVLELSSSNPIARKLYANFGFFDNKNAMKKS